MLTTNNPKVGLPWGCRDGMKIFSYLERARDRRYPLVDESRGLVWAIAAFDIPPGRVLSLLVDGKPIDRPQEPRSIFLMELFKVVDGEIVAVDVVVQHAAAHQSRLVGQDTKLVRTSGRSCRGACSRPCARTLRRLVRTETSCRSGATACPRRRMATDRRALSRKSRGFPRPCG